MKWIRRSTSILLLIPSTFFGAACSSSDNQGNNPTVPVKYGYVSISNAKIAGISHSASAGFYDATSSTWTQRTCQISHETGCEIHVCPITKDADGGTVDPTSTQKKVPGGTISIRGAAIDPVIKLEPGPDGAYPLTSEPGSIWSGGEDIVVQVDGDSKGVPAFTKTLKAPSMITVSAPAWPMSSQGPTIDRSRDLDVAWSFTGTASGSAQVFLTSVSEGKRLNITCSYPIADKQAKVPASVLGQIAKGDGFFFVNAQEQTDFTIGDWSLAVYLDSNGAFESGLASGRATFQ